MPTWQEVLNENGMERLTRGGPRAKRIRTVVVDDDSYLLEALCAVLELRDLVEVVGTAQDGAEAVQLAATLSPELVIMDVHMPRMDGPQALRLMAQHFPETKVVLMSSDELFDLDQRSRVLADGFISKMNFLDECVPILQSLFPAGIACFTA